jgi:GT2 family glycosyltransferase
MSISIHIVIINWQRPQETIACVQSLVDANVEAASITAIDNGSRDGSVERIRVALPQLHIEALPENFGFGRAANIGMKRTFDLGYDATFLLNNDARVERNTLAVLGDAMIADSKAGVLSAKVLMADQSDRLWTVGGVMQEARVISLGTGEVDRGQYDAYPLDFVYGCAMLLRSDMIRIVGGFDERFFMYYEDIDLCLRAREAGYSVRLVPQARVLHLGSWSTHDKPAFKVYHETRSRLLFFAKHVPRSRKGRFHAAECRYQLALMLRRASAGRLDVASAGVRGYLSGVTAT